MVSAFDTLTLKVLAHPFFHLWCLIFYQNKNKNNPFVTLFIVRLYRQVHEECLIKKALTTKVLKGIRHTVMN